MRLSPQEDLDKACYMWTDGKKDAMFRLKQYQVYSHLIIYRYLHIFGKFLT